MNENHPSAPGTSHTAPLAMDDEFGALMSKLTLNVGGQAELAATAREQVLMDHQHKLWGSEAQAQQGRRIREARREIMESSETTTPFNDIEPISSSDLSLTIAQREQQSSMLVHQKGVPHPMPLEDEIYREELNSNEIPESPPSNTIRSPGQQHPQPGMQPSSRTVLEPAAPPRLPDIRGYHEGKFMSKYDVRYISNQQMNVLASKDPYKDDFYYHTHLRRTEEKMRVGYKPLPPVMLPLSNEVKDLVAKHVKDENCMAQLRTRAWEGDHKILGHFPRLDTTRPRLLLLLSEFKEIDDDEAVDGEEECKKGGAGFTSQLWKARVSIMNANDVLLNVEELMHLLALPDQTAGGRGDLLRHLQGLIDDLGCSLGLPRRQQVEEEDETNNNMRSRAFESQLDLHLLAKVLELPKGKRAAIRSIPLLHPDQRWPLIPSMIAIMLAKRPSTSADSVKIEEEMFAMVKSLILGNAAGLHQPAAPLSVVSRCLELILTSHRERKGSLKASLGSISRGELLQAILERGSEVCNNIPRGVLDSEIQSWNRMHVEFVELVSSS
eukprot:167832_1